MHHSVFFIDFVIARVNYKREMVIRVICFSYLHLISMLFLSLSDLQSIEIVLIPSSRFAPCFFLTCPLLSELTSVRALYHFIVSYQREIFAS